MTRRGAASAADPPARPADGRRRVLLIEDDRDIAEAIAYQLEKAGLQVRLAYTGEEGLEAARRGVDLVLLDLNLPNMDGLEVCRMIRRQSATAHVPIIIVSARGEEVDRVLGLEMGADDYVVKPFSLKELAARCRVALRRSDAAAAAAESYRDENFEVEFDAFLVRYRGQEVRLTPKEFELFRYLVERRGPRGHPRAPARPTSGATTRTWRRAASTPTSAGCASSWAPRATTSRPSWASATGSSAVPPAPAR